MGGSKNSFFHQQVTRSSLRLLRMLLIFTNLVKLFLYFASYRIYPRWCFFNMMHLYLQSILEHCRDTLRWSPGRDREISSLMCIHLFYADLSASSTAVLSSIV